MFIGAELLEISIASLVLALGMRGLSADLRGVIGKPSLLLRVLIVREVLIPLGVMSALTIVGARSHVTLGAMLLAISPASPWLFRRRSAESPRAALTVATSTVEILLSILVVPCWLAVLSRLFMENTSIDLEAVTRLVCVLFLLPLALGLAVRRVAPDVMMDASNVVILGSRLLLLFALVTVFVDVLPLIPQLGKLFAILIVVVAMSTLGIGHVAARRCGAERSALALTCLTRHPALALLVAQTNFPGDLVAPAVVVTFLIGVVVALPYALVTRPRAMATALAVTSGGVA